MKHLTIQQEGQEMIAVGCWTVSPSLCVLTRADRQVRLEPKVMDLLVLLTSVPGNVFSRNDIEQILWPGMIVGEDTLARTISKLRKALGDSVNSPTYIQTIPKRGYRIIAKVHPFVGSRHSTLFGRIRSQLRKTLFTWLYQV